MPIVLKKEGKDHVLGIWHSLEPLDALLSQARLTNTEYSIMQDFKSENRKREYLTVRVLVNQLYHFSPLSINYDDRGKPTLSNSLSISISHTREYVAILLSPLKYAGIDLETIRPGIQKIAHKFVNEKEASGVPSENKNEHLHVIWGAKEVLYKIYGKGDVDFRKHMDVGLFNYTIKGTVPARFHKEDFDRTFPIHHEKLEERMLAWAIGS
ncbi:MAG TPA: 4'-phosphopantetheinyl transferase superfamily protein [Bacteroidia bacterium]|nr:4'-phosphopantetheinyl transferase superfamily protein [Bacteroidia bacterium]